MQRPKFLFLTMLRCRRAATAVEYSLIATLIVVAIIAAIKGVGSATGDTWNNVADKVKNVT